MPGRSAAERAALDREAQAITRRFMDAGFELVRPDVLQPADVFLDRWGEDIRQRTYVFTDPAGRELCLRPDITVPLCRYHLEHAPRIAEEARYCYAGPVFRFQPASGPSFRSSEIDQVGVEWFAAPDREMAEAEILALTLGAVAAAGLGRYRVKLGDLGIFAALLSSIDMPARWRQRLRHQFWRPQAFRECLRALGRMARHDAHDLVDEIAQGEEPSVERAETAVASALAQRDIPLFGGRSHRDIAERLCEKALDRKAEPIPPPAVECIERYLAIEGPPAEAVSEIRALFAHPDPAFGAAVDAMARRLAVARNLGLDPDSWRFSAVFGRNLEYYTGFVFQVKAEDAGAAIAGGGRYDGMLSDIGAPVAIPAVGSAIYLERLLAAVGTPA